MAPNRRGRSSGLASPPETKPDDVQPQRNTSNMTPNPFSAVWVEPYQRPPVPSYKDHYVKEYEGNISTVHMKALGQMPTQKDVEKRYALKGVKGARKNEGGTRQTTPAVAPQPPRQASAPPATNGKDVDSDYTPTTRASGKPSLTPAIAGQLPPKVFDADPKGPIRLKRVVESVVRRAEERKTPELGKAIEKLWLDSFREPAIAELIDAVLSQKPTPEQSAEFQRRVKVAKSQISEVNESSKQSSSGKGSDSKSSLKSPSRRDRGSLKRRLETAEGGSDAPGSNIYEKSNNANMQDNSNHLLTNGTPSKRPSKQSKRSTSISSSTSSLSSLTSSDQGLPPPNDRDSSVPIPPPSSFSSSDKQQAGPKLHTFSLNRRSKSTSKRSLDSPALSADDEAAAKRRKLRQTFDVTVTDSDVRDPLTTNHKPWSGSLAAKPVLSLRSQPPRARSAASHQRLDDNFDTESSLSPVNGDLLAPPFAGEQTLHRGPTPTRLGRPPKNVKKGARVKMSPQKSRGTYVTAGRPRADDAPHLELSEHELPDNEDNCAACGGEGQLLLCETCVRAFHYTCVEPPQGGLPDGKWYCRACIAHKNDQAIRHGRETINDPRDIVPDVDGVFGPLFDKLHGQSERCYALPKVVADAFEGVKAGLTGEYEETLLRNRVRNAEDEMADIKKFRESIKNGTALCFACGGSSNEDRRDIDPDTAPRELVSCDYCILSWHLDCLDPPRASNPKLVAQDDTEPLPKVKGKKKDKPKVITTWMCPNHVGDDLNGDDHQGTSRAINGGRIGKLRRPKHATIKDVNLRRGFHNNGLIEILNDPSDIEKDLDEPGVIYRLPEKSIKLDFIDRVTKSKSRTCASLTERDAKRMRRAKLEQQRKRAEQQARQEDFRRRSFAEQQTALALQQFKDGSYIAIQTGTSKVENLIGTLIQEAPQDVQGLFTSEETLSDDQKALLRAAKEHIDRLLARSS